MRVMGEDGRNGRDGQWNWRAGRRVMRRGRGDAGRKSDRQHLQIIGPGPFNFTCIINLDKTIGPTLYTKGILKVRE